MQNTEAFLLALDRIDAVHREPTQWEAACLFSALGAMASGNEHLAEQKIALCGSADLSNQRSGWSAPEGLTVAGLRRALAALSDLQKPPGIRPGPRAVPAARREAAVTGRPHHDDRPICEWCGRGRLEVAREWRDPSSGVIGVTLKCESPACAKLTVV